MAPGRGAPAPGSGTVARVLRLRALLCCMSLLAANAAQAIEIIAVETARDRPVRATATELHAEDVPGRGSFREGCSHWRLEADGPGTRLRYETRFVPEFWVPSLIGAGILARAMKRMTLETIAEAEKRAAARDD